jgi:hypothetical protein
VVKKEENGRGDARRGPGEEIKDLRAVIGSESQVGVSSALAAVPPAARRPAKPKSPEGCTHINLGSQAALPC